MIWGTCGDVVPRESLPPATACAHDYAAYDGGEPYPALQACTFDNAWGSKKLVIDVHHPYMHAWLLG